MKLTDLNPELKGTIADGVVIFDCPFPGCDHRVRVHISAAPFHERPSRESERVFVNPAGGIKNVKVWQATGEFPDSLTLQPSIDIIETDEQGNKIRTLCWHGFVTNGDAS